MSYVPGTWMIKYRTDDYIAVGNKEQNTAMVNYDYSDSYRSTQHAHLVAAAPELLSAARDLVLNLSVSNLPLFLLHDKVQALLRAVNKAEGGTLSEEKLS